MSDRQAAIEAAILRLTPDQMTSDGKPSVGAINEQIEADGHAPITASERDALWAEREAEAAEAGPMDAGLAAEADDEANDEAPDAISTVRDSDGGTDDGNRTESEAPSDDEAPEAAPEGKVRIYFISAPAEPLPLYVHGVGRFELRPGQTYELPEEAVDALRNSDARFEVR